METINPDIAKEWHPTKNGELKPIDVTSGSSKKVWWVCSKGHIWQTSISNRKSGKNCPFCSGQKVSKDNCLATINPELAKQWHPIKNGNLKPTEFTSGSGKSIWWICNNGHEWEADIYSRNKGRNCPICYNLKRRKIK